MTAPRTWTKGDARTTAQRLNALPPVLRHRVKRMVEAAAVPPQVREDGRCQRCKLPALSFCTWSHPSGAQQWRGAYIGGAPPNPGAFTCLACLDPAELERVTTVNGAELVEELMGLLNGNRSH